MRCYAPLRGYRYRDGKIRPQAPKGLGVWRGQIALRCGQCWACRLNYAKGWAVRCIHELEDHELLAEFVTLTYNDANLPADGSLDLRHWQLFAKKLRNRLQHPPYRDDSYDSAKRPRLIGPAYPPRKFRFYMAGEYGEDGRPHFHVILFGIRFHDRRYYKTSKNGDKLYTSATLEALWNKGFTPTGDVTFQSAAYVAGYVTDKLTGKRASEYGERKPPFATMSRRPGIGAKWIDKWLDDVYKDDYLIARGVKLQPPKYYDTRLQRHDPDRLAAIKQQREINNEKNKQEWRHYTPKRLKARQKIVKAKIQLKKRNN